MARTHRRLVPFLALVAMAVFGAGCVQQQAPPAKLPAWLTQNLAFVKASVEGTVLVDARPADAGKKHHGGVGIVIDARHALVPAHVVRGAASVAVHPRSFYEDIPGVMVGDAVAGRIVAIDDAQDAALFESAEDLGTRIMTLDAARRPEANEHVWYFGKGNATRFGNVTAPSVTAGPMNDVIQVAVDAADGDSGAPLVTDDGRVVGFLYATSVDNKRTYFVPIGRALAAVRRR
jgi:S1-C subfamily serine protease